MNILLARTPPRILISPDKAMCVLIHGADPFWCVFGLKRGYIWVEWSRGISSGYIPWILFWFLLFLLFLLFLFFFNLKSRNSIFAYFSLQNMNIEPVSVCITRPACRCTGTLCRPRKDATPSGGSLSISTCDTLTLWETGWGRFRIFSSATVADYKGLSSF